MFDLSLPKLLVLAVIALVVFGPHELPKIASQAGRALRDLRKIAEGAKNDLREGLGPEFADFEIEDLNPKRFMQKHLFEDVNGDTDPRSPAAAGRLNPGPTARCSPPASAPPSTPTPPDRPPGQRNSATGRRSGAGSAVNRACRAWAYWGVRPR